MNFDTVIITGATYRPTLVCNACGGHQTWGFRVLNPASGKYMPGHVTADGVVIDDGYCKGRKKSFEQEVAPFIGTMRFRRPPRTPEAIIAEILNVRQVAITAATHLINLCRDLDACEHVLHGRESKNAEYFNAWPAQMRVEWVRLQVMDDQHITSSEFDAKLAALQAEWPASTADVLALDLAKKLGVELDVEVDT